MSLGYWSAVRGCPGWYYGLLVQKTDGSVSFNVENHKTGQAITDLTASKYRTTTLAHRMGDKRKGYQHVAQQAIRALDLG